jgi:hypothetical protein
MWAQASWGTYCEAAYQLVARDLLACPAFHWLQQMCLTVPDTGWQTVQPSE